MRCGLIYLQSDDRCLSGSSFPVCPEVWCAVRGWAVLFGVKFSYFNPDLLFTNSVRCDILNILWSYLLCRAVCRSRLSG